MNNSVRKNAMIIAVGSGNSESLLNCPCRVVLGQKYEAENHELIGGSCVNYTMRLLAAGEDVFPVPLVGDDRAGRTIRDELLSKGRSRKIHEDALGFMESDDFFIPGVATPKTTIIVSEGSRTVFFQRLTEGKRAEAHLSGRMERLTPLITGNPVSVMIGHISVDGSKKRPGALTKGIIRRYHGTSLILVNPGKSQICHGIEFWDRDLSLVDIVQLNLEEAKELFKSDSSEKKTGEILRWFQERGISAVITLDRFGSIGTYRDGSQGMVFARPLSVEKMVDPTGAGDAFASGMVSLLRGNRAFSFNDFKRAMERGRTWATYACTTLGASGSCPGKDELEAYRRKSAVSKEQGIEVIEMKDVEKILAEIHRECR